MLPEGGETMGMMHEECVLNGSGEISFGCIAAKAGDELVRYSSGARPILRGACGAVETAAERAGETETFSATGAR